MTKPLETPKKYRPLEEAADDIRTEIARGLAAQRIAEALKDPERVMKRYSREFASWKIEQELKDKKDRSEKDRPEQPSLSELAQDNLLVFEETADAIPYWKLIDEGVGGSIIEATGDSLAQFVFREGATKDYQLIPTSGSVIDSLGDRFLVWRTEKLPAQTPKLENIRDQVIQEWKLTKARELAGERAKEMAKKGTEQGGALSKVFPKTETDTETNLEKTNLEKNSPEVTDSGSFTWVTTGLGSQGVRLSEVDGVAGAGHDFHGKDLCTPAGRCRHGDEFLSVRGLRGANGRAREIAARTTPGIHALECLGSAIAKTLQKLAAVSAAILHTSIVFEPDKREQFESQLGWLGRVTSTESPKSSDQVAE